MQEGKQQRVRHTRPMVPVLKAFPARFPPWQIYMVEFNIAGLTQREEHGDKSYQSILPSGRRRGKVLSFACSRVPSMEFAERREFWGRNLRSTTYVQQFTFPLSLSNNKLRVSFELLNKFCALFFAPTYSSGREKGTILKQKQWKL